ncbi:hypothetical protein HGB25_02685 [Candidatus Saccharibacteria bacterium]|nr:hypothetical protein [Candidatus Saccharibacteria bacterium]
MKRILFIKSLTKSDATADKDWVMLQDGIADRLKGVYETEVASFGDLAFFADGKQSRVWHINKGYDIADFDLVVFRRVGDEIEKAISAAQYLSLKAVPFIDQYLLTQGKGKLAGAFIRTANKLPVPRTFYSNMEGYLKTFRNNPPFSYPFVIKADNGSKGRDNYLARSYEELVSILDNSKDNDMVAQEFIPNDGDMRVLMLNGKASIVILRKGKDGSHLNNTSQGGSASVISPSEVGRKIISDCRRAAELEELQVAGVDIVVDKNTGKHYLLEVNRAPQLATGAFVDEKLEAYGSMISDMMKSIKGKSFSKPVMTIGRVETVCLPGIETRVHARIDTGAKTSAVWASKVRIKNERLYFRLFDEGSNHFSNTDISTGDFSETVVASSNGNSELRYKVKLGIVLKGRKIQASFTLTDRSSQVYPVLIGRNVLRGKFVVDIKKGKPLRDKEKLRTKQLRKAMIGE